MAHRPLGPLAHPTPHGTPNGCAIGASNMHCMCMGFAQSGTVAHCMCLCHCCKHCMVGSCCHCSMPGQQLLFGVQHPFWPTAHRQSKMWHIRGGCAHCHCMPPQRGTLPHTAHCAGGMPARVGGGVACAWQAHRPTLGPNPPASESGPPLPPPLGLGLAPTMCPGLALPTMPLGAPHFWWAPNNFLLLAILPLGPARCGARWGWQKLKSCSPTGGAPRSRPQATCPPTPGVARMQPKHTAIGPHVHLCRPLLWPWPLPACAACPSPAHRCGGGVHPPTKPTRAWLLQVLMAVVWPLHATATHLHVAQAPYAPHSPRPTAANSGAAAACARPRTAAPPPSPFAVAGRGGSIAAAVQRPKVRQHAPLHATCLPMAAQQWACATNTARLHAKRAPPPHANMCLPHLECVAATFSCLATYRHHVAGQQGTHVAHFMPRAPCHHNRMTHVPSVGTQRTPHG